MRQTRNVVDGLRCWVKTTKQNGNVWVLAVESFDNGAESPSWKTLDRTLRK